MCSFHAGDAAAPALRSSALMQSHDQLSVTAEGNDGDHVLWHHSQIDMNGSSNCNSILRTQEEGIWPSSSCRTAAQHIFEETIEKDKASSEWHRFSAYSTANPSRPKTEPILDPSEKFKKAGTAVSCRLFGIDLMSQSVSAQPLEKASLEPLDVSAVGYEGSVVGSQLKHDVSKSCGVTNRGQSQVWPKENLLKQKITSSRSRTKVYICT